MAHVYLAYAHPIGEEADVCWMAVGTTREAAMARLTAKVREGWYATDAELDADGDEEAAAEVRAERDSLDLENDSSWVVVIEGDFLA